MNYKNLFDKVPVAKNTKPYSLGIEVEFTTRTDSAMRKYLKSCKDEDYNVFGVDGAGLPTLEFRSPVFTSVNKNYCIHSLSKFVVNVQSYLVSDFSSVFSPYHSTGFDFDENICDNCNGSGEYYCESCGNYHDCNCCDGDNNTIDGYDNNPFGIHFSIGNSFFSRGEIVRENIINSFYYERAKKVQECLKDRLAIEDIEEYDERESRYPGDFSESNGNHFKRNDERVEFRFFPSCDLSTLIPYIEYIIIGKDLPKSQIKYIK